MQNTAPEKAYYNNKSWQQTQTPPKAAKQKYRHCGSTHLPRHCPVYGKACRGVARITISRQCAKAQVHKLDQTKASDEIWYTRSAKRQKGASKETW